MEDVTILSEDPGKLQNFSAEVATAQLRSIEITQQKQDWSCYAVQKMAIANNRRAKTSCV